jgi:3-oxoacyl-[acyl-carrier protein] reductase
MNGNAEDHVIIVTGGGGGLGGAMSRGLLAAGRRVAAVDIEAGRPGLDALVADARAQGAADRLFTTTADVRDPAACTRVVQAVAERFGEVHGLINNAALGPYYTPAGARPRFYEVPAERWQRTIDTNVNGAFLMASAVAPRLVAGTWGRIVNVTTSLGTMTMGGMAPYGPAKGALEASAAVWAADLADTGVTVNVLVPGGAADTQMVPDFAAPDRSQLISPQVMVAPIVWLTSRASDGVTARRFLGNKWDPQASADANVRTAGAPVAWPG